MRTLIVHNTKAGFGSDAIFEFERALLTEGDECAMRILMTDKPNREILDDAEDFDLVVLSGGDGTIASLLYQLRGRDVLTCVFPSGTANLYFSNLGNAAEPAAIARACRKGHATTCDLGEVMWLNSRGKRVRRGFGLMAGLGFDAQLMQAALPAKKSIGQAAYFTAALANPKPAVQRFTITVDGVTYQRTGISCIVANNAKIQGDIEIVPGCRMDDGLLDVIMIETDAAAKLLKPLFIGIVDRDGKKIGRPRLEKWQGRDVRIETDGPIPMQVDGDVVATEVTSYIARVLPGANKLVVDSMSAYHPENEDDEASLFGGTDEIAFPEA